MEYKLERITFPVLARTMAPFCASSPAQAQDKKPNIVVIMGDDIGIANIGAYSLGMMAGKTPNLDNMAKEGTAITALTTEIRVRPTAAITTPASIPPVTITGTGITTAIIPRVTPATLTTGITMLHTWGQMVSPSQVPMELPWRDGPTRPAIPIDMSIPCRRPTARRS